MYVIFFRCANFFHCYILGTSVAFCIKPSATRTRTFVPQQQSTADITNYHLAIIEQKLISDAKWNKHFDPSLYYPNNIHFMIVIDQ
ncbi:Poly(A) polymerase alpha [Dirofilaria immitis]